jgi:hypothetical protein
MKPISHLNILVKSLYYMHGAYVKGYIYYITQCDN